MKGGKNLANNLLRKRLNPNSKQRVHKKKLSQLKIWRNVKRNKLLKKHFKEINKLKFKKLKKLRKRECLRIGLKRLLKKRNKKEKMKLMKCIWNSWRIWSRRSKSSSAMTSTNSDTTSTNLILKTKISAKRYQWCLLNNAPIWNHIVFEKFQSIFR